MNVERIVRTYNQGEWLFRNYVRVSYPCRDLEDYIPAIRLIPEFVYNQHRFRPVFTLYYNPMLG